MTGIIVITTGNELLYGGKTDTNAGAISRRLREAGLDVSRHVTVGDDGEALSAAVAESLSRAPAVIVTGGLGPTDDDITVEALQDIFHYAISVHEPSLERMRKFFKTLGKDTGDADLKMVRVPETAAIIENGKGLAPGFILEKEGRFVIALPGVPREMEDMLDRSVVPFLLKKYGREERESLLFTLVGMKESEINESVKSLHLLNSDVTWGMTAEGGVTKLYFSQERGKGMSLQVLDGACREVFGGSLLGEGFTSPEEELLHILIGKKETVATAESCTGGLVAKRLTDVPGSSAAFRGGVVAYGNDVKTAILGVDPATLSRYGAVSEETAAAMARGARKSLAADNAVSTTGIAGPGGGTDKKPVGTVCFGIDMKGDVVTFTRILSGDRDWIRRLAAVTAVETLRRMLLKR